MIGLFILVGMQQQPRELRVTIRSEHFPSRRDYIPHVGIILPTSIRMFYGDVEGPRTT